MTKSQYILSEVAKIVGAKSHVVAYAISSGHLPEPSLRIAGKRVFSTSEVEAIKTYFQNRPRKKSREATDAPE